MTYTHLNQTRRRYVPVEYCKEDLPGGPTIRTVRVGLWGWQIDIVIDDGG
jgi:hypothetical protein